MDHPLRLLPPKALIKTGEVDHADWNFRPLLGPIIRMRYKLIVELLGTHHFPRLLEIGYGSGVFMPQLIHHCDELYGIDVHHKQHPVSEMLTRFNVTASLISGNALAIPSSDNFFACVVAVSTLEFIEGLDAACLEFKRVLQPGGCFVIVTPGHSPLLDFGLKILTGESARKDFGDRRQTLIPTLLNHFVVQEQLTSPRFGSSIICLYTALKLRPITSGSG